MLNSKDSITTKGHGMKPNAMLVQLEKWTGVEREAWPGACCVARQAVAADTGRVLRLQVRGNENDCRESRPGGKQAA